MAVWVGGGGIEPPFPSQPIVGGGRRGEREEVNLLCPTYHPSPPPKTYAKENIQNEKSLRPFTPPHIH
jgi:hypothetical protein